MVTTLVQECYVGEVEHVLHEARLKFTLKYRPIPSGSKECYVIHKVKCYFSGEPNARRKQSILGPTPKIAHDGCHRCVAHPQCGRSQWRGTKLSSLSSAEARTQLRQLSK